MAVSTVIKHWRDGSLTLADGTGAPVTLTVPFSVGDFKLSGISAGYREIAKYKVRGTLQTVRLGEDVQPTGSFSAYLADYSDATAGTVLDFVLKQNFYSANISTYSTATGAPYTVDLTWTIEGTDLGDGADHTVVCTDCRVTAELSEGEPNSISISFECLGTVTFT